MIDQAESTSPSDVRMRVQEVVDRHGRRLAIDEETIWEADRQDEKWGADRDLPNGTGGSWREHEANKARWRCQEAFRKNNGTWADIFEEEVAEALAESDLQKLRVELIQCRAVLTQWIDNIDRTVTASGDPQ